MGLLCEHGFSLRDAMQIVPLLKDTQPLSPQTKLKRQVAVIEERLSHLGANVLAIEALWDGDTSGWFLTMSAVVDEAGSRRAMALGALRAGSDMRLFNGSVPPWPEAQTASALGARLAAEHGAAFWFPSPEEPDCECPCWLEANTP